MAKVSKEELLKIAKMSKVELLADEIAPLQKQVEDVLSYAERVQEVAADTTAPLNNNVNVFREDLVVKVDTRAILERAPEREDDFFVVPAIIEGK